MLIKGTIATAMSGKLGGVVASHNKGGAYFRALTIPTNPNSPQQIAVRNAVAFLSNFWANGLTADERRNWDTYAENVTITNRVGDQVNISGLAHYVRSNVSRIQASVARVDDGPPIFNLSQFSRTSMVNFSVATQVGDVEFGTDVLSDPWANVVGGFLFIFISRPQNNTINFFRGPYRLAAVVVGDPTPPVSPVVVNVPFPFAGNQKLFGRAIAATADGRLATPRFMSTFTAP